MAATLDPLAAIHAELQVTAADPTLDPLERGIKLRDMRGRLVDLLGSCDELLGRVTRVQESDEAEKSRQLLWARTNADVREALLESSGLTEAEVDEAGFTLSHVDLDRLEEEGLLESVVRKAFDEQKYRRQHGKFADKPGSGPSLKGRGAAGPKVDERYRDYFRHDPDATVVHISRLKPTRKDTPEHIAKARRYLDAGKAGQMMKRKPLDVSENGDGTLSIIDGNSTHAALAEEGLTHLPVKINQDVAPGDADQAARDRVASDLAAGAAKAEPGVTQTMQRVTADHGGQLVGLDHRLKTHESLARKIKSKQDKYPGMAANEAGGRVNDALRFKSVFPAESYTQGASETITALKAAGYQPWQLANHWDGGDDYNGFHANMRGPDGVNVELQFHTQDSMAAEELNHPLYEKFRSSTDPHERWDLWQQMVKNAAAVDTPPDAASLGHKMVHRTPERPADVADEPAAASPAPDPLAPADVPADVPASPPSNPPSESPGPPPDPRDAYEKPTPEEVHLPEGTPLYHVTHFVDEINAAGFKPSAQGESGPGIYLTDDPKFRDQMASAEKTSGRGGVEKGVVSAVTTKKLRLIDRTTPEGEKKYRSLELDAQMAGGLDEQGRTKPGARMANLQAVLQKAGYEGVRNDSAGDMEIVLHDPAALKVQKQKRTE